MHQEPFDFIPAQVERVFPDIPVVDIAVLLQFGIVGEDREISLIKTEQALDGKERAEGLPSNRRVVDGMGRSGSWRRFRRSACVPNMTGLLIWAAGKIRVTGPA
jgi:hypothetical protein